MPYYLKGKAELHFRLYWEWILMRFDSKKRVAVKEYFEYIQGGVKDIENPGLEAAGGWISGSEDWVKNIIKKSLSKIIAENQKK